MGVKGQVALNLPRDRTSRIAPKSSANPKKVNPREFPGQLLKVSAGKLFWNACHEEVGLKKSILRHQITSVKHMNGKVKLADSS